MGRQSNLQGRGIVIKVVVGAQYGSEGKGVIVSKLSQDQDWDAFVRVGAPNAGHSHFAYGKKWVQRMLPIGWAANQTSKLILGAGAVVDKEQLAKEIAVAMEVDPTVEERTYVDWMATKLTDQHRQEEGKTKGALWHRIGSTGEGVGAARVNRMRRTWDSPAIVGRTPTHSWQNANTVDILHNLRDILIEGTQGSGLSLTHGEWPYVTTCDPNVSGILADCGIPPSREIETVLVARTFPIRVAGNSGPLWKELTWDELSARVGKPLKEQTTVTKLVRRVGEWDDDLFAKAVKLNGPREIALTFMDYVDPKLEGCDDWAWIRSSNAAVAFIEHIENTHNVEVTMVGTGGPEWSVARKPRL
jgi:adenylosuccinate synthase